MGNPHYPDMDDQYRKPTRAPEESGGSWLGNLLGFGGPDYVDEADPSWEEVVTMVVIPGNPNAIRNAAGNWEVLFRRIEQVKALLDDGIGDLQTWQGQAGEAYRAHLSTVSSDLGALVDQHKPVIQQLDASADNLETAIDNIPIPDEMIHEVMAAKQGFIDTGQISNGFLRAGSFYDVLLPIYGNRWMDEIGDLFRWDWASDKLRDWLSNEDDKAKQAYQTLTGQHVGTMDSMPAGQQMTFRNPYQTTVTPGTPGSPGTPSSFSGSGGFDPDDPNNPYGTGLAGVGSAPGAGGFGGGGPGGTSGLGGLGSGMPGTTGLGAAGGAGSTPGTSGLGGGMGAGMGAGAMGAGAGGGGRGSGGRSVSGLGGGGVGAGGIGAGAGGRGAGAGGLSGRPGSGAGAGGVPGAGGGGVGAGGAGAGRGGAGAGRGGMGAGMAPMGGGGHGAGGGGGDDHTTWLNEDEDVWGAEGDAAPPVLGG